MKTHSRLVFFALVVAFVAALPVHAQTSATGTRSATDSLSTLPDSDLVFYVNASRILNDAMPRLVPEKELQKMRDGMDQMKAYTNVDLRKLESLVIVARFNKPSGGTLFPIPEAMLVMRGDFDATALVGMGMAMSQGMLHEEKFGEHTLYALKLSDIAKDAAKNPFGAAFAEIAVATLDANTLAIGNKSFIKSALDAADGRGRIKSETVASVLRDQNVLISATGSPLMSFAKSFGLRMAESRDPNCMTRFGEYYVALTMGDNVFNINGAMNADNPDTAVMMKNMLSGLLQEGKGLVPGKDAQAMLDRIKLVAEGDEVSVVVTIPEEMMVKFIREMMAPPPPKPAATETKTNTATTPGAQKTVKPKPKTRTRRRTT